MARAAFIGAIVGLSVLGASLLTAGAARFAGALIAVVAVTIVGAALGIAVRWAATP